MNSVLYHQKKKVDSKRRQIYIGEDAYPYADAGLIIAADGLGGRGGYPHTKINKKIIERKKFYDIVFEPVFSAQVTDEFKEFVLGSFSEVFETADYYFDDSTTMRSSGYFASRLVTAIMLYEMKYNPDFDKDEIFAKIKGASPDEVDAVAQEYGDKLAALLLKKLEKIADNVGFEIETKISGAYLLPSTLVMALTDEHEDSVDVLYIWAGDSRGYLWDKNGLGQITEDHERDETMTNLITLTTPFRLEGRFVTVPKPCILFNATDGCYKCPIFASPFDLEYIFLQSIDASDSFAASSKILEKQFSMIGRHDDSNTMALVTFGYEDYEAVKSAVKERLADIDKTIIAKLPGILERDYTAELAAVESEIAKKTGFSPNELIEDDKIAELVKTVMGESGYVPMAAEAAELEERRAALEAEREPLLADVRAWVEKYWLRTPQLKRYSTASNKFDRKVKGFKGKDPYDQYAKLECELDKVKDKHRDSVNNIILKFNIANQDIADTLTELSDMENSRALNDESVFVNIETLMQVIDFIKIVCNEETQELAEYKEISAKIDELNAIYVEYDKAAIEQMASAIVEKTFDLRRLDELSEIREAELLALIEKYDAESAKIEDIDTEIATLGDKYLMPYWNENADSLSELIIKEHRDLLPKGVLKALDVDVSELEAKKAEIENCCAVREEIYQDYDKTYTRAYRESKI